MRCLTSVQKTPVIAPLGGNGRVGRRDAIRVGLAGSIHRKMIAT